MVAMVRTRCARSAATPSLCPPPLMEPSWAVPKRWSARFPRMRSRAGGQAAAVLRGGRGSLHHHLPARRPRGAVWREADVHADGVRAHDRMQQRDGGPRPLAAHGGVCVGVRPHRARHWTRGILHRPPSGSMGHPFWGKEGFEKTDNGRSWGRTPRAPFNNWAPLGGGGTSHPSPLDPPPPPHPTLRVWATIFSRPWANEKISLAPLAPVS